MYKHVPIIITVIGCLVLIIGLLCQKVFFPKLSQNMIINGISLRKGNDFYESWRKPSLFKFNVYIFNITNPDEFRNGLNTEVQEVGPYIYDLYKEHIHLDANERNDTLKFYTKRTYYFNEKDSKGLKEDDFVTVIDVGVLGAAQIAAGLGDLPLSIFNHVFQSLFPNSTDMFLRTTVGELLFSGVRISCIEDSEYACGFMQSIKTLRTAPNGRDYLFSIFGYLNGTEDGPFVIERGLPKGTKGKILSYQDQEEVAVWDDYCSKINGTDGSVYPNMFTKPEKVYVFDPDICRSVRLRFEKEIVSPYSGLPCWRFVNDKEMYSEEDSCFCEVPNCPPDGVMDLTPCLKAPILVSNPHFYQASDEIKSVTGMRPQKDKHEVFLEIEPLTGVAIQASKKAQMSMRLSLIENFQYLSTFSTTKLVPFVWIDERYYVGRSAEEKLKGSLDRVGVFKTVEWCIIALGVIILISAFVMVIYTEKLLCFDTSGNTAERRIYPVEPAPERHFNTNIIYPHLYPQLANKNISYSTNVAGT